MYHVLTLYHRVLVSHEGQHFRCIMLSSLFIMFSCSHEGKLFRCAMFSSSHVITLSCCHVLTMEAFCVPRYHVLILPLHNVLTQGTFCGVHACPQVLMLSYSHEGQPFRCTVFSCSPITRYHVLTRRAFTRTSLVTC